MGLAHVSVTEGVALRARNHFNGQVTFSDGHGDAGHLLEVRHHVVEGSGESADFVVAMNIDVLIKVTGIADLPRDGHEMVQGLADRASRVESDEAASNQGHEGSKDGNPETNVAGSIRGL